VQILDASFDMYDFHTRQTGGRSNLGWCGSMYYPVIQKLVRDDAGYWLYYAILRQQTNLIAYPYQRLYITTFAKSSERFPT
jgi:hypothetical protein